MNIPFLDIKAGYIELKSELDAAVVKTLESGRYILGEEVESFEREFAAFCGAKYCVSVGNGLDALHLSLLALKVGPGDEVIVPSNTYIATWLAISQCGATPIPVEPDLITYNIDVKKIEQAVTSKTKGILPVHLFGNPVDIDSIVDIGNKYSIKILEDGAQAHGALYKNKKIGGHGNIVAWSFYPGKNLGAFGDGGAITTDNEDLAESIKALRNYGSKVKYVNDVRGFNSRLDPVQASVLRIKLRNLERWNSRRKCIADMYIKRINNKKIIKPKIEEGSSSAWHLFVVQHENRNNFQKYLASKGIETLIHYPIPPHRQKAYSDFSFKDNNFPIADFLANSIISLPIGPHLDDQSINYIIDTINDE